MTKTHYYDGIGICLNCDSCQDDECCRQSEVCSGTNWDFMDRIHEIAEELKKGH